MFDEIPFGDEHFQDDSETDPSKSEQEPEDGGGDGGIEWGEPILFGHRKPPEIPARLLPGLFGEFAEALSNATETPEAMAAFGVIGVVSAVCSHHFFVSPKPGWNEPINVYALVAIGPGNQKSLVLRECTAPLIEWEQNQAEVFGPEIKRSRSERKTQEKLIESRRTAVSKIKDPDERKLEIREIADLEADLKEIPALPQIFATDATPESLALNVHEQGGHFSILTDEGGIMEVISGLYTGGQANIDIILKGIDGGAVRVRRKDRSFDLNPYLTLCPFVQPAIIERMGQRQAFSGNGMLERFLYVLPESRVGHRSHDTQPVPEAVWQAYRKDLLSLLSIKNQETKRVLELSPPAFKEWREFQNHIEKELRPNGKLQSIPGWGGKISGYVLRLAGLLHVMETGEESSVISQGTMARALELGALLIDHAVSAFAMMGAEKGTLKAHQVFDWIKDKGATEFRKRECFRALRGQFANIHEFDAVLSELEGRNIISEPRKIPTDGRPGIFFEVNPAAFDEVL
ncbi:hypothetical protein UR09_03975 [Candidatus Nitromaritima sp. SCGC AAA799-A02]|nr:hypothetical protein UR09_03975 [Candidatus Nitromaritima sp. SCGC AAA799-A02]